MSRDELITIVTRIVQADGTEEELDVLLSAFCNAVPHPGRSDLIFYPADWGFQQNLSPIEIVDIALGWKPKIIAMKVLKCQMHKNKKLYCLEVAVPEKIITQVISELMFNPGDICKVALSGVKLKNGRLIKHGFIDQAYSAGEILEKTNQAEGYEFPSG